VKGIEKGHMKLVVYTLEMALTILFYNM